MNTENEAFGIIDPNVLAFQNSPAKLVIEGPLSYEAIAAIQVIASRDRRYKTELDKITAEVTHEAVAALVENLIAEWQGGSGHTNDNKFISIAFLRAAINVDLKK